MRIDEDMKIFLATVGCGLLYILVLAYAGWM